MSMSGKTRVFAVIGDPVAHSLSPLIHNRWIAHASLDAIYLAVHLPSPDASQAIRTLARAGFSGLSVTLPHKRAALEAADKVSPEAKLVGAANTLALQEGGTWSADNTDVEGFALAVRRATNNGDLKGRRVVLIGAGGAARAAIVHFARLGARLTVVNRTTARAEALTSELAPEATAASMEQLPQLAAGAAFVVNSASLGHAAASLPPLPPGRGRPFLDLSYGKAAAGTLKAATDAGWTAHDGLPMLVGQAAAAFRLWWKIDPDMEGALKACRASLAA